MRLHNGLVAIIFYQCVTGFAYDPFEYTAHEEQYVTNPNDIILLDYNASLPKNYSLRVKHVVAAYELNYQSRKVIVLGIYSDDIIGNALFEISWYLAIAMFLKVKRVMSKYLWYRM